MMGPAPAGPLIAIDVASAKIRAPYDVQVVRENGETLPTYAQRDRFYVQGNGGERYTIRISNPTPNRVEAVVSIDGLDAVDGEPGDLRKRGYIVPPYGEVRVEGFRTSLDDVATFRFSSVDGSYAGQKGKARNVGVIAVALFEEEAPPPEQQIVTPNPYRYEDDVDASAKAPSQSGGRAWHDYAKDDGATASRPTEHAAAKRAPAPPPTTTAAPAGATGADSRRVASSDAAKAAPSDNEGGYYQPTTPDPAPATHRPGLGTEYGETRYSSASYTRFVRSAARPVAIAELRYNDAPGLMALGIQLEPLPGPDEMMVRETADPFPGDHFSRPVR